MREPRTRSAAVTMRRASFGAPAGAAVAGGACWGMLLLLLLLGVAVATSSLPMAGVRPVPPPSKGGGSAAADGASVGVTIGVEEPLTTWAHALGFDAALGLLGFGGGARAVAAAPVPIAGKSCAITGANARCNPQR